MWVLGIPNVVPTLAPQMPYPLSHLPRGFLAEPNGRLHRKLSGYEHYRAKREKAMVCLVSEQSVLS